MKFMRLPTGQKLLLFAVLNSDDVITLLKMSFSASVTIFRRLDVSIFMRLRGVVFLQASCHITEIICLG